MNFDHSIESIIPDVVPVLSIGGTGGLVLPSGNSASRPNDVNGPIKGTLRFNTNTQVIEAAFGNIYRNVFPTVDSMPAQGTNQAFATTINVDIVRNVITGANNTGIKLSYAFYAGQIVTISTTQQFNLYACDNGLGIIAISPTNTISGDTPYVVAGGSVISLIAPEVGPYWRLLYNTSATASGGAGTVTSVNITAPTQGILVTGGPITSSGTFTLSLTNDLAAIESLTATSGLLRKIANDTWELDTNTYLTSTSTITTTNISDFVSATNTRIGANVGSIIQGYDVDLDSLASLTTFGFSARQSLNTWITRTLTGTALNISVVNGDGIGGNPVIDLINAGTPVTSSFVKITTDTKGRVTSTTPVVAADIPLLNQNTTGTSSNITGVLPLTSINSISPNTVLGNISATSTAPTALSTTELTSLIQVFDVNLKGLVPPSGTTSSGYLNSSGTWTNIRRSDLADSEVLGNAITHKIIAGTGISISSSFVESGTGEVTINALPVSSTGISTIMLPSAFASTAITPVAIPGWSVTVTAGKIYKISIIASYQTVATGTGGRLGVSLSSGAGTIRGMLSGTITQVAGNNSVTAPIYAIGALGLVGSGLLTPSVTVINSPHMISGDIVFICTTSGTLTVDWASEIAGSSAQINANSVLMTNLLN